MGVVPTPPVYALPQKTPSAIGWNFDWFYYRLLRPLIVELGPRSRVLANVLLVLADGNEIYVFQDGAYRLVSRSTGAHKAAGFDALVRLSEERRYPSVPELDPENMVYLGRSSGPAGIDSAMAGRVGLVINVGDAMLDTPGQPLINLHRGYLRTIDLIVAASAALNESGRSRFRKPRPLSATHSSGPSSGRTSLRTAVCVSVWVAAVTSTPASRAPTG